MFIKAKPIWAKGYEKEWNTYVVFCTQGSFETDTTLHLASTGYYRVFINGEFQGAGPARTAKGYLREDVFSLPMGECEIIIEAVGYYCHSLATVWQTSCLYAEIRTGERVLVSSGADGAEGFSAYMPNTKVQKVERYSVQRYFTEVWDFRDFHSLAEEKNQVEIGIVDEQFKILDRHIPYPFYNDIELDNLALRGKYHFDECLSFTPLRYSWKSVPTYWGCYEYDDIQHHPFAWVQRQRYEVTAQDNTLPITLEKGEYAIFDFQQIEAGFITASINALQETDLVIAFSEFYEGATFQFTNMNVHNVLEYFLRAGQIIDLQSFEPYTFRFLMVAVKEGSLTLEKIGTKTYEFDTRNVTYVTCENESVNRICQAAIRNFAHNAVDLYMDCPSRERAGWLCDSFFTAKAEYAMTGDSLVEDAFLENYRLYECDGQLPENVLPQCYPSDISPTGDFIPQWTMWYILEVEEYLHKRGRGHLKEAFRESIYKLLEFYQSYENEDGLLEKLPAWNFVEWSDANSWTQDVNYPTNFLYAKVLESIGSIYGDKECRRRSDEVRKEAIRQSFNGTYFMDHSIRNDDGKLVLQEHSSEAGQYYAILFGNVDIHSEKYQGLKHLVYDVFAPTRTIPMPEILEINAFIGAYLRLETLLKLGEYDLVLHDIDGLFGKMAERTGTLWEYRQFKGSFDHGFASYSFAVIQEALKNRKE